MTVHQPQRIAVNIGKVAVIVLCVGLSVVPLLVSLPLSVFDQSYFGLPSGRLTGKWFAKINTTQWREAIGASLMVGVLTSLVSVPIAAIGAYHAVCRPLSRSSSMLRLLVITLLIVPPVWIATGFFRVMGEGSMFSLVVPHALLAMPAAFICLWYGMTRLDFELQRAAEMLGASQWSILTRVYLPSIRPYVVAAFFLAFVTSWDETVFPLLLTGPEVHTVSKQAFESMRLDRDLTIAAVNVISAGLLAILLSQILRQVDE